MISENLPAKLLRKLLLGALALGIVSGTAAAGKGADEGAEVAKVRRSGLGLNLGAFVYWSSDAPLINHFKRTSNWVTQCRPNSDINCSGFVPGTSAWDTKEPIDLDANGYPKSLPTADEKHLKYRTVAALLFAGDKGARQAGRYVVLYEGKGKVDYGLAAKKLPSESVPGRDVIEVSAGSDVGVLVSISSTTPSDHIRNIRMIPPGGVCEKDKATYVSDMSQCKTSAYVSLEELAKTQVFHPAFLSDLRGFRTLRFLDWSRANDSKLADWSNRPKPGDAFWSGPDGVPLEVMFDLSKEAGADPWINVPPMVNDDYVRQFARLAKKRLGQKAILNLEYGNEPWNTAFPASRMYEAQGRAKWPAEAQKQNAHALRLNWYALRAAQVCALVKQEFGDQAGRVKCIANTQSGNVGVAEQILACPLAKSEIGAQCAKSFDALAIAPYFGNYIGLMSVRSTVSQWFMKPDGGVSMVFDELFADTNGKAPLFAAGHKTPEAGALAEAHGWVLSSKAIADKYGLPLYAYEGGQHITREPVDTDPKMLELMYAANRDSRMGAAYTKSLEQWKAAGGQVYALYYHAAPYTRATFGLKEKQFQTDAPKWSAATRFRDGVECWWNACKQ